MSELKAVKAPAGSGKTTEIKQRLREWTIEHPHEKLLCITFTNRAANGLKNEFSEANVEISTIHSFLRSFTEPLFALSDIVDLYLEEYRGEIEDRIQNIDCKPHIDESNARYSEKLGGGPLSYDLISGSITSIYYNEMQFNSPYTGGLSHERLLSFIGICAERFPLIYRRISSKFSQVIIDEYQDTNVDVLEFFVRAVEGSHTKLHLFGDKMQQIYPSDTVRFQAIMQKFSAEERTVKNYRSSPAIVSTLNKIYNDESLKQVADKHDHHAPPRLHISSSPSDLETQLMSDSALVLSVHNATIFRNFGAPNLLKVLQTIPEHDYNSQHSAVSVLSEKDWEQTQSPLIKLLFGCLRLEQLFEEKVFGSAIQVLRRNPKIFGVVSLYKHDDKAVLRDVVASLFTTMRLDKISIGEVVKQVGSLEFPEPANVDEYLTDLKYASLLEVPFAEVRNTYSFNQSPTRSTQHGVKGESHESVIFMAENSTNPPVHMDMLFNVWPKIELNLIMLEDFAATIMSAFSQAETNIGSSNFRLNAAQFAPFTDIVQKEVKTVFIKHSGEVLFDEIFGSYFSKFLRSPNVSNSKKLFKISPVEGLIAAYKLFYVGCSRAEKDLDIIIEKSKVNNLSTTKLKFESMGFEVKVHDE